MIKDDDSNLLQVEQACQGNLKAYENLILNYQQIVHSYVARILHDHHETEDVCQLVFIKGYLNIKQLIDKRRFGGWLKQIALNECRLFIRKAKLEIEKNVGEKTWGIIDPFIEEEIYVDEETIWIESLEKTLELLSKDQCELLEMFYIKNLSYAQISNFLEIPLGTVKKRLFNTRKTIQNNIQIDKENELSQQGAEKFLKIFKSLIKIKMVNEEN